MKKILLFLVMMILVGCQNNQVTLKNSYTIEFYTITTCSECIAFKKNGISYLEKNSNNKIKIEIKDLDDKQVMKDYDKIIQKLKNFDQEYYGMGPFINIKGHFVYLGYQTGDEKDILKDIQAIDSNTSLTQDTKHHRFLYK